MTQQLPSGVVVQLASRFCPGRSKVAGRKRRVGEAQQLASGVVVQTRFSIFSCESFLRSSSHVVPSLWHSPIVAGHCDCKQWVKGTSCPTELKGRSWLVLESSTNGREGCLSNLLETVHLECEGVLGLWLHDRHHGVPWEPICGPFLSFDCFFGLSRDIATNANPS